MVFTYEKRAYLFSWREGVFLFPWNPHCYRHHYFLLILREKIAMIRTMFQRILRESLIEVAEHPALVRIAFLTGFVHTLWGFRRFAYTFYVVVEKNVELWRLEWTLFQYLKAMFDIVVNNLSSWLIVLLVVSLIVGYVFLYPIGHGMMVSYLQHHSTSKAIRTALGGYFTITITEWLLSIVCVSGYHLLALRYFYQWGILGNILIQIIVFLIAMFVIVCSFLYAYGSISCVIDEFSSRRPTEQAWEALQNSSNMATKHIWTTMKFILLSLVLELRFFVTTTIVIAIPAFLVRVALQLGLIGSEQAPLVVMIAIGVLLVAAIYINSIIDAFFTAYWYKLYSELKEKPEE